MRKGRLKRLFTGSKIKKINFVAEDVIFVNINELKREFFEETLDNPQEYHLQEYIFESLEVAKKNPERYGTFYYIVPERTWSSDLTVSQLVRFASYVGDHMANRTEVMLMFAQTIINLWKTGVARGMEPSHAYLRAWRILCNFYDTLKYQRIFWEEDGCFTDGEGEKRSINCSESYIVWLGGATELGLNDIPFNIGGEPIPLNHKAEFFVPAIISYENPVV